MTVVFYDGNTITVTVVFHNFHDYGLRSLLGVLGYGPTKSLVDSYPQ